MRPWSLVASFVFGCFLSGFLFAQETPPQFVSNQSPVYSVSDSPEFVNFYSSVAGRPAGGGERESALGIYPRVLEIIKGAKKRILASAFLFDSLYSDQSDERLDIVEEIKEALKRKIQSNPDIQIAIILDPSHRGYSSRVSPAEAELRALGVDFFYTDLLHTSSSTYFRIWEGIREIYRRFLMIHPRLPGLSARLFSLKIPFLKFDNAPVRLRTLTSAGLIKANHRKLIVADQGESMVALVSSANPHNASIPSWNHAFEVSGPAAEFIYMALREDIAHSLSLDREGFDFVHWGDQATTEYREVYLESQLPSVEIHEPTVNSSTAQVQFLTEEKIKHRIIEALREVNAGDQVRIQMFYLSDTLIIEEILLAAERTDQPIRILLDPNKDAFNKKKDGTPNRQVAAYMMKHAADPSQLEIRWALTSGEQNHAKSISIYKPETGKSVLIGGSANWTRRNLGTLEKPINLESDLVVEGSSRLSRLFNTEFDILFENKMHPAFAFSSHPRFSVAWDDPEHSFHKHAGLWKWSLPSCIRVFNRVHSSGRPHRIERSWTMF